ncbi:hypothetical protein [Paenarthrobacter sp. PH39-S1]|uniref:hypothetical protein n=1 Tax=Paenarthrobacter sp. PH39-S1 TaxID=3046204 RepID=UPI0024B9EAC7|nr:hypothetical protein [Paenarthrobacter sp. PH39-S1]MDJ0358461.1 hypothetical protein [Paenarthrobacter sp. PH39-S1]
MRRDFPRRGPFTLSDNTISSTPITPPLPFLDDLRVERQSGVPRHVDRLFDRKAGTITEKLAKKKAERLRKSN